MDETPSHVHTTVVRSDEPTQYRVGFRTSHSLGNLWHRLSSTRVSRQLGRPALLVYNELARNVNCRHHDIHNGELFAWPSVDCLAEDLLVSRAAVNEGIRELKRFRLVERATRQVQTREAERLQTKRGFLLFAAEEDGGGGGPGRREIRAKRRAKVQPGALSKSNRLDSEAEKVQRGAHSKSSGARESEEKVQRGAHSKSNRLDSEAEKVQRGAHSKSSGARESREKVQPGAHSKSSPARTVPSRTLCIESINTEETTTTQPQPPAQRAVAEQSVVVVSTEVLMDHGVSPERAADLADRFTLERITEAIEDSEGKLNPPGHVVDFLNKHWTASRRMREQEFRRILEEDNARRAARTGG